MENFLDTVAYMQRNGGYEPHTEKEFEALRKTELASASNFQYQKRPTSTSSAVPPESVYSLDSDSSHIKKKDNTSKLTKSNETGLKVPEMYTIRVPETSRPGQVLKVTDPLQKTVLSVVVNSEMRAGEQATFAPKSIPVNDHAEGYQLVQEIEEEELLHRIRLQGVDRDMDQAQLPLVQAYAEHNKTIRWAMSAEERLLRQLVVERLDPAVYAPPGVICSSHLFFPARDDTWVSSVEGWHRSHGRPAPDARVHNESAHMLRVDPRLQRRIEPVETACDTVLALARAVRLSMRRARETYSVDALAKDLAGEVEAVPVWPSDSGGNAFRVTCLAPRLFCRVRDRLGLTHDAVARELDAGAGVWQSGRLYFFGGARRLCLQARRSRP